MIRGIQTGIIAKLTPMSLSCLFQKRDVTTDEGLPGEQGAAAGAGGGGGGGGGGGAAAAGGAQGAPPGNEELQN